MTGFWNGFFKKAAKEDTKQSTGETAALVGAGTTGVLAAGDGIINASRDRAENRRVSRSRRYSDFQKSLKPGDILFSRYDRKSSPDLIIAGKHVPGFSVSEGVQAIHGSPYYHAQIYLGKGRTAQATGMNSPLRIGSLKKSIFREQAVKAYRPTGASAKEVERAIQFAERAKGTPYKDAKGLAVMVAKTLAGVSPSSKNCKTGPNGSLVCTTLPAAAYSKQFPKEYMTPNEMRATKGMKLVSRYGKQAPSFKEAILGRVVSPALRKARYGVGAAALTAAALKGRQLYDERNK